MLIMYLNYALLLDEYNNDIRIYNKLHIDGHESKPAISILAIVEKS